MRGYSLTIQLLGEIVRRCLQLFTVAYWQHQGLDSPE
jgi:hypothetical protein